MCYKDRTMAQRRHTKGIHQRQSPISGGSDVSRFSQAGNHVSSNDSIGQHIRPETDVHRPLAGRIVQMRILTRKGLA